MDAEGRDIEWKQNDEKADTGTMGICTVNGRRWVGRQSSQIENWLRKLREPTQGSTISLYSPVIAPRSSRAIGP
jgi:hypothetical protein